MGFTQVPKGGLVMKLRFRWLPWLLSLALLLSPGVMLAASGIALDPAPTIPIFPTPVLFPDLTVTVSGPAQLRQGQPFGGLVKVVAANNGLAAVPGSTAGSESYLIDLELVQGDTRIPLARITTTPNLNGGQSVELTPSGTIPASTPPGDYCLTAVIDPTNRVAEAVEDNNSHCVDIAITRLLIIPVDPLPIDPPTLTLRPDLTVSLNGPGSVSQGASLQHLATVTVANGGVLSAPGSGPGQQGYELAFVLSTSPELPVEYGEESTRFRDGAVLPGGRITNTVDLYPGESVQYAVQGTIPVNTPPGIYCLGAVVDPAGRVSELSETNNTACLMIRVVSVDLTLPLPDPEPPEDVPGEPAPPPGEPEEPAPPVDPAPPPVEPPGDAEPPAFPKTCATQSFSDLPSTHPACAAVSVLVAKGIINGYEDGTFRPERAVTRAEFAKMYTLAVGIDPRPGDPLPFSDTTGHWANTMGFLAAAVADGAIVGFPDGTFRPDDLVTRAQGVKIVTAELVDTGSRAMGPVPADVTADLWYYAYVAVGIDAGLMGARAHYPVFAEAAFAGDTPMTRAEAALLLANLLVRLTL